jgi:hypothetical protein
MLMRHVMMVAGRIESMSGMVDPSSHLNLDYVDHKVTTCVIAEKFEIGAKVKIGDNGLVFAIVDRSAYNHYGYVDYTQRLFDMIDAVKRKRQLRVSKLH